MATDTEAEAGTDETRYVNSKQVKIVKNGTYSTASSAAGPNQVQETTSTSFLLANATIAKIVLGTSQTGSTSELQVSADDATWSNLYALGSNA